MLSEGARETAQRSGMMHALVFERAAPDASATRIAEVPLPDPGPGQIAVDVACAGVNFIDVMARLWRPRLCP